jgi:hypothetical protein
MYVSRVKALGDPELQGGDALLHLGVGGLLAAIGLMRETHAF